jgi:hypothetical protein
MSGKSKPATLEALTIRKGAAAPSPGLPPRSPDNQGVTVPPAAPVAPSSPRAEKGPLVPLNFRVPAEFREAFESYAFNSSPRRKMVDLLKDAFQALQKHESTK